VGMKRDWAVTMQNIDRRVLYVALLVIVTVGLLVPLPLPLLVGPQARELFQAIDAVPEGGMVVVSTNWSASTQGENRPQTRVVLEHCMRKRLRFALIAFDPQSTNLAQELAEEMAREHGYEYGVKWVNWGYRADVPGTLKAMMQDIVGTYSTDSRQRRPLQELTVMQGIRTLRDVGAIVEVSPSGNHKYWIQFVVGSVKAPFCYAPTSIIAPELYQYLDSGQIKGMLFGIKGAAEYESLLGMKGFTTRAISPVSLTLVLLFVLIALGNWGLYAARRRPHAPEGGEL